MTIRINDEQTPAEVDVTADKDHAQHTTYGFRWWWYKRILHHRYNHYNYNYFKHYDSQQHRPLTFLCWLQAIKSQAHTKIYNPTARRTTRRRQRLYIVCCWHIVFVFLVCVGVLFVQHVWSFLGRECGRRDGGENRCVLDVMRVWGKDCMVLVLQLNES